MQQHLARPQHRLLDRVVQRRRASRFVYGVIDWEGLGAVDVNVVVNDLVLVVEHDQGEEDVERGGLERCQKGVETENDRVDLDHLVPLVLHLDHLHVVHRAAHVENGRNVAPLEHFLNRRVALLTSLALSLQYGLLLF